VKRTLRLALAQTAPPLLDPGTNVRQVREVHGANLDRDLIVFPELCLTGYGVAGRARDLATPARPGAGLDSQYDGLPSTGPDLLLGVPEGAEDGRVFNASVLLSGGIVRETFRKAYLPTYGMFDEGRTFAATSDPAAPFHGPGGWKVGVLICEDFWHPALAWLLAMRGADLLVVQAAAPGRGGLEGTPGSFRSMEAWTTIARATALQLGVFVALVNRVGVEGGLTFGGGSLLVGPDGGILEQAGGREPEVLSAELDHATILAARSPYSHLRDDDPSLLMRGLLADHGLPGASEDPTDRPDARMDGDV
jgi:predicted amidohydrolase